MQAKAWVKTDPGLKRDNNQDSFLHDKDTNLFIVADGMGGHKGGEVASAMACSTVKETFLNPNNQHLSPRDIIRFAYGEASAKIFEHAKANPELHGMGTTMVMSHFSKNNLFIANVGDSRCYLIRGNMMWQITEDHSLMNEQIRAGILTPSKRLKWWQRTSSLVVLVSNATSLVMWSNDLSIRVKFTSSPQMVFMVL